MKAVRPILFVLLLLLGRIAYLPAQPYVSAIVTDSISGNPVSNVFIIPVDRLQSVATTDANGRFTLELNQNGPSLFRLSHVAYRKKQVTFYPGDTAKRIVICPLAYELGDVFITADRLPREQGEVPAAIYQVSGRLAEEFPVSNADELLLMVPGIRIDRDRGIFSKNSSINMRGLSSAQRVLVLLDGIPMNKADGGSINWSRIDPDNISRIEVMKGPNSVMYGGNAMGGVVNIITNKAGSANRAKVKAFYGTYNTFGGSLNAGGSRIRNGKGFYWDLNAFGKKSEGYYPVADSLRDSITAKTYLREWNTGITLGYQFSGQSRVEAGYNYFQDMRGDGNRIYEPDGSYNRYPTQNLHLNYSDSKGKWQLLANAYFQLEHFMRQNETIKKQTGKYTLYQTDAFRKDAGLWLTTSLNLKSGFRITSGLDSKTGSVDYKDSYLSSPDVLKNKGVTDQVALFSQAEIPLVAGKINFEAGLRLDRVDFYDGSFSVEEPSSLTEFMESYATVFHDTTWYAVSPRLALLFKISGSFRAYLAYSHGFRPPMLDDMCRFGNVNKGFKLANPGLGPENLENYETGYTVHVQKILRINQSLYYSLGNGFQYFVSAGDSVYTGGSNLKPVIQRRNISKATIAGSEINVTVNAGKHVYLFGNFTYNHSVISEYKPQFTTGVNLEGNRIAEVPVNQLSAGIEWHNDRFMAAALSSYTGKVFTDDENLITNPARSEVGLRLSANYRANTYFSVSVQDLFNQRYIDNKGNISPGRFILISLIQKIIIPDYYNNL